MVTPRGCWWAGVDTDTLVVNRHRYQTSTAGDQAVACTDGARIFKPHQIFRVEQSDADAIVHIEDKPAIYGETFRVLKPHGQFVAGDWFASENADDLPEFRHYLDLSHLTFAMQTAAQAEEIMHEAGFSRIHLDDRNTWYAKFARQQTERIEGMLKAS